MQYSLDHVFYPSSAHISSTSRFCAACVARGILDIGRGGCGACLGESSASKRTGFRTSGLLNSSSSSLSTSSSMPKPALRAALISMGLGREKMDWPDLSPTTLKRSVRDLRTRETCKYVLSHHCSKPSELQNVPRNQQKSIKYLFFFASRAALRECKYKQRECTKHGENEVHHIEW